MAAGRVGRAWGAAGQAQQSPTEWVTALAEGAGRYVAATSDPRAQLAQAQADLANGLARGLSAERLRELQAKVDVAKIRVAEAEASAASSREWAALGKVLVVGLVGFVVVATGAVAYRAVKD